MTIGELIELLRQAQEQSPYGADTQVIAWNGNHYRAVSDAPLTDDPAYDFPRSVGARGDVAVTL